MYFFAFLVALAVIAVNSTDGKKCRCSINDYKPIPSVNLLDKWFTFLRYDNGPQKDAKCSVYEVSLNEAVPGSMIDWATDYSADGAKSCLKGDVTPTSKYLATIHVKWDDSTEMPITIVSSDNENYLIARACYKFEEYVWIMTRTTKPSKKVLNLIQAAIVEQGLDRSKLTRSCVGFKESEPEVDTPTAPPSKPRTTTSPS